MIKDPKGVLIKYGQETRKYPEINRTPKEVFVNRQKARNAAAKRKTTQEDQLPRNSSQMVNFYYPVGTMLDTYISLFNSQPYCLLYFTNTINCVFHR